MGTHAPSVEVRPAGRADAPSLLTLAQAFATSFTVDADRFDRSLDDLLVHDDSLVLVAVDGATVVGYLAASVHPTLYATGRVAWIEELMVDEPARRRGVGRALVVAAEQWMVGHHARMVSLATRRAAEFWTATGYEESAAYLRKLL